MTPEAKQLKSLLDAAFGGNPVKFQPCAIYQERLDSVKILVRDCSIKATRLNEVITVLEDAQYKSGRSMERYIGFTIKGVRHFCRRNGISTDAPVRITEILDAILRAFPQQDVALAIDGLARRWVDETAVDLKTSNVVQIKHAA